LFITSPTDLRLQPASPCIDAGSNAAVPARLTTDAAGNSRIIDYPVVHQPGAIVDMGAYERPLALSVESGVFVTDGTSPSLKFALNNQLDLSSVSTSDVMISTVLSDGSPGSTLSAEGFSFDPPGRAISIELPPTLPDGNYRATLLAESVSDTYGVALRTSYTRDFFILGGDANHDRTVDISDLAILAMNWHGEGKYFSQGDFNYDGKVDAADLGILSSRWQQTLIPPPATAPTVWTRAPRRTPSRLVSILDETASPGRRSDSDVPGSN
jgi:hypothetical protein